ncbi:MAG: flagellar export protein FliJ [Lachnospiraceae bacterium]|nr:flagellar export protein FliJ [Lachnospiraceae bacterium]
MAKFIFKMENILSIKYKLEEQAKAEYGIEIAKLREEEYKLSALKQKKEEYQQKLLEEVSGKLVINKIKLLENSVENIKYNIKIQMVIVKRQEEQVEIAQQKLDNAVKERKIYEKLKEKAFENFKAELNAEEQKEVDELVSFRFGSAGESEE